MPDAPEAATPQRVQLRRTKGWRKPEGAIVVSRPSKWGNPWRVSNEAGTWDVTIGAETVAIRINQADAIAEAVRLHREWYLGLGVHRSIRELRAGVIRNSLGGRDLACWCPPDQPCHADVLLELANQAPKETP